MVDAMRMQLKSLMREKVVCSNEQFQLDPVSESSAASTKLLKLTFQVNPGDLSKILKSGVFSGRLREVEFTSIYLDTKNRAFGRAGYSCRIRHEGKQLTQTIRGPRDSILERIEHKVVHSENKRHERQSLEHILTQLGAPAAPTALKPIFTCKIKRAIYDQDGIEAWIDKGTVTAGKSSGSICEISLVAPEARVSSMFAQAKVVLKAAPVEISILANSDRGYILLGESISQHRTLLEPALHPGASARDGFGSAGNVALCQIMSNRPAVGESEPEALHQLRVGIRRFEVALRLFSSLIRPRTKTDLIKELKWIRGGLERAREIDVFLAFLLSPGSSSPHVDSQVRSLHQLCRREQKREYQRVQAVLQSDRFRMFLLAAAECANCERRLSPVVSAGAGEVVAEALSAMREKLMRRPIKRMSLQQLHKQRLRAKQMRYAIEFLDGLFEGKGAKRAHRTADILRDLQDDLGELTDAAAHRALLRELKVLDQRSAPRRDARIDWKGLRKLVDERSKGLSLVSLKQAKESEELLQRAKPFWRVQSST